MTSKTEDQQHTKPWNGFRIEHQKIHPCCTGSFGDSNSTDWANRQILNCFRNIRPRKGLLVGSHSYLSKWIRQHWYILVAYHKPPALLCSSGGIIPDSSLSQEGSGRFQPYPLYQGHRSHPRSSWERLSGDVSSHVSPTQQVSLEDPHRAMKWIKIGASHGKEFDIRLLLAEGITNESWIFDVFD